MSWENRDYAHSGPWRDSPQFGGVTLPTGVLRVLVLLHLIGWLLTWGLRTAVDATGPDLDGITSTIQPRPLSILLHPYTPFHERVLGGFLQALFSAWAVWVLGRQVLEHTDARRLLITYFLGNLLAGATYFSATLLTPTLATAWLDFPLGALAAWCWFAHRELAFEYASVFGRMVSIATLCRWAAGITAAFAFLGHGPGSLMWAAAAVVGGFAWPLSRGLAGYFGAPRVRRRKPAVRPSVRTAPSAVEDDSDLVEALVRLEAPPRAEPNVDAILAKISRSGLASLTDAERAALEAARQAKLRRESSD